MPTSAPRQSHPESSTFRYRRGVATVELAVTLPLLILIAFGTIETCCVIFTKQALQSAAQECARVAAQPESTAADVQACLDRFLVYRPIQQTQLSIQPEHFDQLEPGDLLQVSVSATFQENGFIKARFFGESVTASCTVVKSL